MNLQCVENQLKALDLSKNPDLYLLYCRNNQLSSLDVSKNPKIRYVSCYNNNLTSLNLKNGKNTIFNIDFWYYVNFKFNPDLKCILVDNSAYSNTTWSDLKDPTASYSDNLDIGPSSITPQTFCIQQNANLSSITITGQNIKWHDTLINGNVLSNTTLLQNGITYFASQTINGCESERIPVLINIQNTPLPTADINQSFCSDSNSTIAAIKVTGNQIKWYDDLTNGSLLAEAMNLVDGQTYYASQTVNNCESERFRVNVSIVNTPAAPIANATEPFCKKENATLNNIQITGQNIKWYDTNSAVASLPIATLLENNKTYYASQTIGCESDRNPVLVRVYDTPLPIASNNQQFCIDENATIANLTITASNSKWYDESINGNILAETTLLQNNKTYYAAQMLNNCESERLAITIKIQDTQIPIANSPQTFCTQKNAKISDIAISGQNINWFDSPTSPIILSELTLLENGITYYASENINNCASDRIPVAIIILEATYSDCINFVDELPYPKFFTPNNDGYNDTWTIDFAYLAPNTGIKIFDRYGKLIKTLVYNTSKWNGTFNGAELPASDYWFVATRANGTEYKGHFSLKR
jgi:gliding motility-associated-like protein